MDWIENIGNIFSIIVVVLGILIGLLILAGAVFLFLAIFKLLCRIHAEIIAEKIDEILEARGIGVAEE